MTVSDHIQKVLKPSFAAAWEEVGDTFEKQETFALSSTKTLQGENNFAINVLPDPSVKPKGICIIPEEHFGLMLHKLSRLKGQDPVI